MRIGILTFHFAINYGAVVQTWTLSRLLSSLGHDVCIINYIPLIPRYPWWVSALYHKDIQHFVRTLKFKRFRRRNMIETRRVSTVEEIEDLDLDAVVVGSDQVWNVDFFKQPNGMFNQVYFLSGMSSRVRKVAYAASMGGPLPENYPWRGELIASLREFDFRSVRERQALENLLRLGLSAQCVIDPTFLLPCNAYDELTVKKDVKRPYLFSYLLTEIERGLSLCRDYLEKKCCSFRLTTIRPVRDKNVCVPSPDQWLSLIRNAQFVITDSFHGVALSIVFNVPFVALLKSTEPGQNARIIELLERLSLSDRIASSFSDGIPAFGRAINWCAVNEKVSELKKTGRQFLIDALAN